MREERGGEGKNAMRRVCARGGADERAAQRKSVSACLKVIGEGGACATMGMLLCLPRLAMPNTRLRKHK